jgi:hypothetical protein
MQHYPTIIAFWHILQLHRVYTLPEQAQHPPLKQTREIPGKILSVPMNNKQSSTLLATEIDPVSIKIELMQEWGYGVYDSLQMEGNLLLGHLINVFMVFPTNPLFLSPVVFAR